MRSLLSSSGSWGFPGGSEVKASAWNAGDLGLIPGWGRSPGEGKGNPLQYSCLENSMDGGAWWAIQSTGLKRVRHDRATSLTFTLVHAWFCLCLPKSLFLPVLWKSYNQILVAFKVRLPGVPSPSVGSLGWENWHGVQNVDNNGRISLVSLFFSLWVIHPVGMGFDLIVIMPLPPSCCNFFFVLDMGYLFWWVPASSCQWLFNS